MIQFIKDIFLGSRFLQYAFVIVVCFAASYAMPLLFPFAQGLLIILLLLSISDLWILFSGNMDVRAERNLPEILSLGDENPVEIKIDNRSDLRLGIEVVDEFSPINFLYLKILQKR